MSKKTGTNLIYYFGIAYCLVGILAITKTIGDDKVLAMSIAAFCFIISDIISSLYEIFSIKPQQINSNLELDASEYTFEEIHRLLDKKTKKRPLIKGITDLLFLIGIVVLILFGVFAMKTDLKIITIYSKVFTILSLGLTFVLVHLRTYINEMQDENENMYLVKLALHSTKIVINLNKKIVGENKEDSHND